MVFGGAVKKSPDLDAKEWEALFKVMGTFEKVFGSISAFAEIIDCKRPMLLMITPIVAPVAPHVASSGRSQRRRRRR